MINTPKSTKIGSFSPFPSAANLNFVDDKFSPLEIFSGGRKGVWYDPSDLSTMFKDAAGTQPVTTNGDPVGRVLDKSGNNGHATQTVSAARPVYRTDGFLHWLEFDGVDDCLILPPTLNLNAGGMYFAMQDKSSSTKALVANSRGGYIGTTAVGASRNILINDNSDARLVDTPSAVSLSTKGVYRINKSDGYLNVIQHLNYTSNVNSVMSNAAKSSLISNNVLGAFSPSGTITLKVDFYNTILLEQHLYSRETEIIDFLAAKTGIAI